MGGERDGEINGVIVAASHPRHRGRSPPVPAVPSLLLVQRGEVKGGAVFKYINNACSMQMKVPWNIIALVMLLGCISPDLAVMGCKETGREQEDRGHPKSSHTLTVPPHPLHPAPPHHTLPRPPTS